MRATPEALFKTLADPTLRAIFERLARKGEQTAWILTHEADVLLRMEQSGLPPEEEANDRGATYGWQRHLGELERVVAAFA